MQILSTSAMSGGGPAATATDPGSSRDGTAGDFGSVLNTMEESGSPAFDSQDDEQVETVEAENHTTAGETEDSEQDPPVVGAPASLAEGRAGQSGKLRAPGVEKVGRGSDVGDGIASRAGRKGGSENMPVTPLGKDASMTSLPAGTNRSVAESSLVRRAMATVQRINEPAEPSQSTHGFPTTSLQGQSALESSSPNPLIAGHPVRQTAAGIEILMRHRDQRVEISLNPEELGRVRMALSRTEHGMTVAITADRPEILDLMRRHIDQLTGEFRRLGYTDIGFSFGSDTQQDHGTENHHPKDTGFAAVPADNTQSAFVFKRTVSDGLDMRL